MNCFQFASLYSKLQLKMDTLVHVDIWL